MDFVRLIPVNHEARLAFSTVVESALSSPESSGLSHAIGFMTFKRYSPNRADSPAVDEAGYESTTDFETDTTVDPNVPSSPKYQGYYSLSLSRGREPKFPALGWFIGLGRLQKQGVNGAVELQLAAAQLSKYQVAGKHARLYFDASGSLCLATVSKRRPSVVLGHESFTEGQRLITAPKSLVQFGSLSYHLQWVINDEEAYQRDLGKYFEIHLQLRPPPPDISASPSPHSLMIDDWCLRNTVGKGASGTVSAAVHMKTGKAVAAKMLVRDSKSHLTIHQEIKLLRGLPKNVSVPDRLQQALLISPSPISSNSSTPITNEAAIGSQAWMTKKMSGRPLLHGQKKSTSSVNRLRESISPKSFRISQYQWAKRLSGRYCKESMHFTLLGIYTVI